MNKDIEVIRLLVRTREDFQAMRKRVNNRIGIKRDGKQQNIEGRIFNAEDLIMFKEIAGQAEDQEKHIEKLLLGILKKFPIYTEFLKGVKGVGTIAAGWIIAELDIHKATTVSKIWQYCGMNPGMIRGKKRKEKGNDEFEIVITDTLVKGDRLTPGFVSPFNKNIKTYLLGVLAKNGFIMHKNEYYFKYYLPYKERLKHSEKETKEILPGGKVKTIQWKEAKPIHQEKAAIRYMMKMFLKDLYVAWRTIEGLEVRKPYQEEYLGHKHSA